MPILYLITIFCSNILNLKLERKYFLQIFTILRLRCKKYLSKKYFKKENNKIPNLEIHNFYLGGNISSQCPQIKTWQELCPPYNNNSMLRRQIFLQQNKIVPPSIHALKLQKKCFLLTYIRMGYLVYKKLFQYLPQNRNLEIHNFYLRGNNSSQFPQFKTWEERCPPYIHNSML